MRRSVIAFGLDAADPVDIEAWTEAGYLPNIEAIRKNGMYGRMWNTVPLCGKEVECSSTEACWVMAQTGRLPNQTGYWGPVKYAPETYRVRNSQLESGYDYEGFKPFYALGNAYKVCAFDVPVSNLHPDVNGIQITGWGGHFPFVHSRSQPEEVYNDIIARYGENPVFLKDGGYFWDRNYRDWVQNAVRESLETRTEIATELMHRDKWDLFLADFGETHTAGHDLYHLSHADSPINPGPQKLLKDSPMLETFRQVDASIGQICAAAPKDSIKVLFSAHGMAANYTYLTSFFFLAEFMYRYNFGKPAIAGRGRLGETLGRLITDPPRNSWTTNLWLQKEVSNPVRRYLRRWTPGRFLTSNPEDDLFSPYELGGGQLAWMPATWYSRSWPKMKAFAVPSFAEGYVRINLKGRESKGIVEAKDYDAVLADIEDKLRLIRCGRTGKPVVKDVVRARCSPHDSDRRAPSADLMVVWEQHATDVVDSPHFGRIGPIPFRRPGGHTPRAFFAAAGGEIPSGSTFDDARAVDIAPTILAMMGAAVPPEYDGKVIKPV